MNRILLLAIGLAASAGFGNPPDQNAFENWVDEKLSDLDSQAVRIEFRTEGNSELDRNSDRGSLLIFGEKFRLELGAKTIASDGSIWQTFDSRTNQLFWQDPDTSFQNTVLYWVDAEHIKKELLIDSISESAYHVRFPDSAVELQMIFSPEFELEAMTVIDAQTSRKIEDIRVFKIPPEDIPKNSFLIPADQLFFFDLRTE